MTGRDVAPVVTPGDLRVPDSAGAAVPHRHQDPSVTSWLAGEELAAVPGVGRLLLGPIQGGLAESLQVGVRLLLLLCRGGRQLGSVDNLAVTEIDIIDGIVQVRNVQVVLDVQIDIYCGTVAGYHGAATCSKLKEIFPRISCLPYLEVVVVGFITSMQHCLNLMSQQSLLSG